MIYKWWHQFVRRRTKPIPVERALLWKRRLSLAYGFIAWNALGLVVYMAFKGKGDWAHFYGLKTDEEHSTPPALAWAKTLGIKNASVIKVSGFTKVDEYEIVNGEQVRNTTSYDETMKE